MLKKEFPSVYKRMMKYGRRNISISTVSPSGSVSILTQTSSGIEPVYMLNYIRRKKTISTSNAEEWVEYEVEHPKLNLWKEVTGINNYQQSPYYSNCAMDITWQKRIKIQAIVQKYTTHSVSSTINLTEDTDKKTIGKIFIMAWEMGLKGVTVYREGSRDDVLKKSLSKKENAFIQKDNCIQC
jgi:ribonucleoside-diphosphate reductase alpha chain